MGASSQDCHLIHSDPLSFTPCRQVGGNSGMLEILSSQDCHPFRSDLPSDLSLVGKGLKLQLKHLVCAALEKMNNISCSPIDWLQRIHHLSSLEVLEPDPGKWASPSHLWYGVKETAECDYGSVAVGKGYSRYRSPANWYLRDNLSPQWDSRLHGKNLGV